MRNKILFLLTLLLLFSCNRIESKIDASQVNSLIVDDLGTLTRYIDYDMGVICYVKEGKFHGEYCISCVPVKEFNIPFGRNLYNRIRSRER